MRVRDIIARGVTLLLALPSVAAACTASKGVDAQQFLANIDRPAHLWWALSVLSALVWYLLPERHARSARVSRALVAAALLQPAWWLSAGADCGQLRNLISAVVGAGSAVTLVVAIAFWRRPPRFTSPGGEAGQA